MFSTKVVSSVLFLMVATVFTIRRLMSNGAEKKILKRTIAKLEGDPRYSIQVARELIKKYDFKSLPRDFELGSFHKMITPGMKLDMHEIHYIQKVNQQQILLVTTCLDDDFDNSEKPEVPRRFSTSIIPLHLMKISKSWS